MKETKIESLTTAPRHWVGLEELEPGYWTDPAVIEKRGQEFHDKPIETLEMIEKMDSKGLARRDFLTIMGASMALASAACARRPVNKIIPYVVKPEEIVPGVPNWYASTWREGTESYGILVKNREGRPIKIEGSPEHPLNRGKLSARAQASLLSLYDPERLQEPLMRDRKTKAAKPVKWDDVDAAVAGRLKGLANGSRQVRVLTGAGVGYSAQRLLQEFLGFFGDAKGAWAQHDVLFPEDLLVAQGESFGARVIPTFHFDRADVVVTFGADFLGTWVSPVEFANDWAKTRKVEGGKAAKLSKLLAFEAGFSTTGANADERYAIRPGDELKIVMALAHEIIVARKASHYSGDSAVASALESYHPDLVAKDTGIPHEVIKKTAEELVAAKGRSLVVASGGLALQVAVNLLNAALENEGRTVEASSSVAPMPTSAPAYGEVAALVEEMKAGKVDTLIIQGCNPGFTLPKAAGFAEAAAKVALVIHIADRDDETSELADYVLPAHHALENWGDDQPRKGLYSLQQPAIGPLASSRAFEDCLIGWCKELPKADTFLIGKSDNWHDFIKSNWQENLYKQAGSGAAAPYDYFWDLTLQKGVFVTAGATASASPRSLRTASVGKLPKFSPTTGADFQLALYSKVSMGDGRNANNAWLQEVPDPVTTITWDNYLLMGPRAARIMNVKTNDVVQVTTDDGFKAELPVWIQPGVRADVVAAAVGYGRRRCGKVGNGAGVDVFPAVGIVDGMLSFHGKKVKLQKTGRVFNLAKTQWHHVSEDRPVLNDVTFEAYKTSASAQIHTNPHLRMATVPTMWTKHEYKGHRWAMAIDLNSCTGCNACVIACQAENNVPVVGRDQVRVSREMHWIRIDRYYSGSADKPDVLFQPMLCQHCENAPCETVCPVLATAHSSEGLNEQIYNRCVGTRYCQNNCPYKVRRFNFFDNWKSYEKKMNLVWNPDITVRTRGIMEKCTFCVQRIREAKDRALEAHRPLADGDVKPACLQTCPTEAIVFGDIKDPKSKVAKWAADPRAFRSLETTNSVPMVSYLTKVRNKEGGGASGGHHTGNHG